MSCWHIVMFAFKPNATPAQIQTVVNAFACTPTGATIPFLKSDTDLDGGATMNNVKKFVKTYVAQLENRDPVHFAAPRDLAAARGQLRLDQIERVNVLAFWT